MTCEILMTDTLVFPIFCYVNNVKNIIRVNDNYILSMLVKKLNIFQLLLLMYCIDPIILNKLTCILSDYISFNVA